MEIKLADLTNHPDIYKDTYWGNFRGDRMKNPEIIENRNQFIIDYKIKKVHDRNIKYVEKEYEILNDYFGWRCDHQETYINENGDYVLIFSPYEHSKFHKYLIEGWDNIYKMYHTDANTYLKMVKKRSKK